MQYSKRDTDLQNSLLDSGGEGEGVLIWETGIAEGLYITAYMKQIASPGLMHDTECSGLAHWDDPEGWYGEGGGGGSGWGTHVYPQGFMLMYGKTNTIL